MEWQAFLSSSNVNKGKKAKRDGRIKIEIRTDEEEAAWAKAGSVLSDKKNAFERITQKHIGDNRARAVERERSAPSAHRCSRPECSAMTTSLSGFRRCAGRCSGKNQAHYCAKECQVQDWSRHRQVCKRAKEKIVTIRDPTGDSTVEIDTSNLKTSQAEMLRMWSEISSSNDIPGPLQESMKKMALQSGVQFNKEQILQHITDWY